MVTTLVTITACLVLSVRVGAEPAASAAVPANVAAATPVDVVLVGRAGTEGSLADRIESWFGPTATLSITAEPKLVAERVLGPLPTRRVAVWVTERSSNEARLYFAVTGENEAATRYLIRDVPLNRGFDEIGSERVAQVVHSSVTALIEGSVEVAERPEIERLLAAPVEPAKPSLARARKPIYVSVRPPPKKPPPEEPGPPLTPLAGAFYRGAFSGDEGLSHGPGLALGGTLGFGKFGAGAVARGQYVFPHTERLGDLDITLSSFLARLGVRGAYASGALHADLELGAGLAWVSYDPEPTGFGPLPAERDVDHRWFGFGSAGLGHEFGPLRAGLRLELEIYAVRTHYDLSSGQEIGSASQFQPALALEIVFD